MEFGASFPDPECDAVAVLCYSSSLFLVIPFNIDFGLKTSPILYILSLEASLANSAQCSGMMRDASRSASWFFIWPQLYCIKGSACCGTTCWSLQIWYSMPTWRWRRTETNWIAMRFARTYWTLVIPLNSWDSEFSFSNILVCFRGAHQDHAPISPMCCWFGSIHSVYPLVIQHSNGKSSIYS